MRSLQLLGLAARSLQPQEVLEQWTLAQLVAVFSLWSHLSGLWLGPLEVEAEEAAQL